MGRSWVLESLPALLLPGLLACGASDPPGAPTGPRLLVRVDPGLGAGRGGGELRLRAWGPWWAPLWSRILPQAGEANLPLEGPLEGLHWFTLESGGKPAAGVRVVGGQEEQVYHLVIGELEISRSELGQSPLEPLTGLDPSGPWGFPGGGIGLDRGGRSALWTFSSPELHLRALWLLPWREGAGRYAVVQVEDPVDGEEWGTPQQEWVLEGPARQLLAPCAWQRLFTAGTRLEPWPAGGDLPPSSSSRPSWWAPAWEAESRPDGLLFLGHADWRRFFLTVPRAGSVDLLPLWHSPAIGGEGEDPPRALWRLAWSEAGRRLAGLQLAPRFPGLIPALALENREWALLLLEDSGGLGAGLQVGGAPLAFGLAGPGPPVLLLETLLTAGATANGLLFWPQGSKPRLELAPGRTHAVVHRDTLLVTPSFDGPRAATTRSGG